MLTAMIRLNVIHPTRRPHFRLSPPLRLRMPFRLKILTMMENLAMATTMENDIRCRKKLRFISNNMIAVIVQTNDICF
jgi:hypothetical protein